MRVTHSYSENQGNRQEKMRSQEQISSTQHTPLPGFLSSPSLGLSLSEPRVRTFLPGLCSPGVGVIIFPDPSPRWAPGPPSSQADELARGQSEQKPALLPMWTCGSGSGDFPLRPPRRQHPRPGVAAVAERLGMVNADPGPRIWAADPKDDELCKTGVEWLPAGYTQEYTLSQTST